MDEHQAVDPAEVGRVMESLLSDVAATAGLLMTQIGIRAGLWRAMAGADGLTTGPTTGLTAAEVAARSGVAEPYAREWLRHQAASGYVDYDEATQRFALPAPAAAVLAGDPGAAQVDAFADLAWSVAADAALSEHAFRTGEGVAWHQRYAGYGAAMDAATRAMVVPGLVSDWIPAVAGLEARLRAGARVADVGCGRGAALVALAGAYPASRFHGYDYHDAAVAAARKAVAAAGVTDRVSVEVAEAGRFPGAGYDLILFVDALHDLGDPVGALRQARRALRPDGCVMLVEFAVADQLTGNLNPWGRLTYAVSALVCTPSAISQQATDPLGAAPGQARLTEVAGEAGFGRVARVPVTDPTSLVLALHRS